MELLMGIDLGTSSVKSCIADREGNVLSIASQNYEFDVPKLGQAEQSVKVWWDATVTAVRKSLRLLEKSQIEQICGIGFSGQMHGMVCLDKDLKEIRPAILHCDQRARETIEKIYQKISLEEMGRVTFNRLSPGFLLGSLMWVKDHEPDNYERIWKLERLMWSLLFLILWNWMILLLFLKINCIKRTEKFWLNAAKIFSMASRKWIYFTKFILYNGTRVKRTVYSREQRAKVKFT